MFFECLPAACQIVILTSISPNLCTCHGPHADGGFLAGCFPNLQLPETETCDFACCMGLFLFAHWRLCLGLVCQCKSSWAASTLMCSLVFESPQLEVIKSRHRRSRQVSTLLHIGSCAICKVDSFSHSVAVLEPVGGGSDCTEVGGVTYLL